MADKKQEQYYTRPPKLGKWEGFSQFVWNPETHQFLGRTGSSWGKILLFYVLFYAVLTGFFAAMLAVFYQTLDQKVPKWQLDSSLIGSNPGLGFRPMPPDSNVESTLIWYKSSDKGNIMPWQKNLDEFLHLYNRSHNEHRNNLEECQDFSQPSEGKVCDFSMNDTVLWRPCTKKDGYGFGDPKGGPCIFLKLNKIYNWIPEYYNEKNIPEGTSYMKDPLKEQIKLAEMENKHYMVWVTCEGENPADIENIGPIRYIPKQGFPSQYFPYKNRDGYLSPLVAVHLEEPKRGVLINIECKAWAKNIFHDRAEKRGSVHFELMVD